MQKILAIDGNSIFHRAYHSGLSTATENPNHAVPRFMAMLTGLVEMTKPNAVVVGFDDPTDSVRKSAYPEYKAQRAEHDDNLRRQLETVRALTAKLFTTVIAVGLEADDVVASAAALSAKLGWRSVVATSDRDAFALIDSSTDVLRIINGGLGKSVLLTTDNVLEQIGVRGDQYLDYAALRGDNSDNLPGVNGIGEKTAQKLLRGFDDVDQVYAAIDAGTDAVREMIGAYADKLTASGARDAFIRNRAIMTLRRDVLPFEAFTPLSRTRSEVERACKAAGIGPSRALLSILSANQPVTFEAELTPVVDSAAPTLNAVTPITTLTATSIFQHVRPRRSLLSSVR